MNLIDTHKCSMLVHGFALGRDTPPLQLTKITAFALMYNSTLLEVGDLNMSKMALSCQCVVAGLLQQRHNFSILTDA